MLGLFFEEYWSVPLPVSYFNISKSHFECRDLILLAKKKLGETLLAKKMSSTTRVLLSVFAHQPSQNPCRRIWTQPTHLTAFMNQVAASTDAMLQVQHRFELGGCYTFVGDHRYDFEC
jgi:hypothetical protein